MSKTWTFFGGMLAGVASVFAAAAVAVELEERKEGGNEDVEARRPLELPEGKKSEDEG